MDFALIILFYMTIFFLLIYNLALNNYGKEVIKCIYKRKGFLENLTEPINKNE